MAPKDPARPPLPIGAAVPAELHGSGFNDGAEPWEIRWTGDDDPATSSRRGPESPVAGEDGEGAR